MNTIEVLFSSMLVKNLVDCRCLVLWCDTICHASRSISFWGSWWTKGFSEDYTSMSFALTLGGEFFMLNVWLKIYHLLSLRREFSVSSMPFRIRFHYLVNVLNWYRKYSFQTLLRLVDFSLLYQLLFLLQWYTCPTNKWVSGFQKFAVVKTISFRRSIWICFLILCIHAPLNWNSNNLGINCLLHIASCHGKCGT